LVLSVIVYWINWDIVDTDFAGDPFCYVRPGTPSQIARMYLGQDMPANYYRPSHRALFNIQYPFFGKRPQGYHITDITISVLCTLAVFLLVKFLSRDGFMAFASAIIFGTHPAHAAVTRAMDTRHYALETLVSLAAFYLLVRAMFYDGGRRRYVLGVALAAFAFTFDALAITFPLLLLLYELMTRDGFRQWRRFLSSRILYYVPLFLIAFGYLLLKLHIMGEDRVPEFWDAGLALANLKAYIGYLVRPIPAELALPVFLAIVVVTVIFGSRHARFFLVWVAVTLLPVHHVWHERATYLATVGYAVVVGWLLTVAVRKLYKFIFSSVVKRPESPLSRRLALITSAAILIPLVCLASQRTAQTLQEYDQIVKKIMLIPRGIEAVRPEMPSGSVVYLVGDPIGPEGTPILPDAFSRHLTFIYSRFVKSDTFDGFLERLGSVSKFPEDKILFVEYRDGRVVARPDVMDAMRRKFALRPQAERYQRTWELGLLAENAPWSVVRPGHVATGPDCVQISTYAEDCIVKSPNCTISPLAVSVISVTMSVSLKSDQSLMARLYFATPGQSLAEADHIDFPVACDGRFHTYEVDVGRRLEWLLAGTVSTIAIGLPRCTGQTSIQRLEALAKDLPRPDKPSLQIALPGIQIQGPPQRPRPYELPYIEQ